MVMAHNFVKWAGFRIGGAELLGFTAGEPISASVHINSIFSNETIMTAVTVINCSVSSTPYYI
jgi:hypothetical protein